MSIEEFLTYDMPEECKLIFDVSDLNHVETINLAIDVLKGDTLLQYSYGEHDIDTGFMLLGFAEDLHVYIKKIR